uniref:eIF3h C-terminal domain-containing protein n=1 Tax=Oncorhynchus tshawytscha TaxID=74940 RepID=A0AAZ3QSN1_ONCTS
MFLSPAFSPSPASLLALSRSPPCPPLLRLLSLLSPLPPLLRLLSLPSPSPPSPPAPSPSFALSPPPPCPSLLPPALSPNPLPLSPSFALPLLSLPPCHSPPLPLPLDPIKTAQGSLSLKAYRLTPKLMEICKEKDFSAEGLKKAMIGFEHMFEEVPIVIKNSHLINVLMWELEEKCTVADKHELLNLSSSNHHLEKSLQLLMDRVDDMSQDIVKYNTYSRNLSKQQQQKHQYIQRRQQENAQRQTRGETPLPEEDVSKMFKPPQPPPRMDTLLIAGQINNYCQNVKEFTSQNLGKLFMAEALQGHNS